MDISKLTRAQLVQVIEQALMASGSSPLAMVDESPTAAKPKRGRKAKAQAAPASAGKGKAPKCPELTEAFTIEPDRRASDPATPWASEYSELRFCDANGNGHPLGHALRDDDVLGKELVEEIKAYAQANRVGNSKIRYNRKIGAWVGRTDMFPARLRKLAGVA